MRTLITLCIIFLQIQLYGQGQSQIEKIQELLPKLELELESEKPKEAGVKIDSLILLFSKESQEKELYADLLFLKAKFQRIYQGNYKDALLSYRTALEIKTHSLKLNNFTISETYNEIGMTLRDLGKYNEAIENYKLAISTCSEENCIKLGDISIYNNNIGVAFRRLGDFDKAIIYYHKALDERLARLGDLNPDIGITYNNLGVAYRHKTNHKKALFYYEKALKCWLNFYGKNHPNVGWTLNNIGVLNTSTKNYNQSEKNLNEAIKVWKNNFGEDHPRTAMSIGNLGVLYEKQENYTKAINYFSKALKIKIKHFGTKHHEVADTYLGLANTFQRLKNFDKSNEYFIESLNSINYLPEENLRLVYSPDLLTRILKFYGQMYQAKFDALGEVSDLRKANEVYLIARKILDFQTRNFSKNSQIKLAKLSKELMEEAIRVKLLLYEKTNEAKYKDEAFIDSERVKNFLLFNSIQSSKAIHFGDIPKDSIDLEKKLSLELAQLEKKKYKLISDGKTKTDSSVLTLTSDILGKSNRYETLISNLEKSYPEYYNLKFGNKIASVKDVQNLLKDDEALIEYFTGDSTIYAFLVKTNSFNIIEIKRDSLFSENVVNLQKAIFSCRVLQDCSEQIKIKSAKAIANSSHELYNLLIKPIEKFSLPDNLIIIPDGLLGYISFELLVKKKPTDPTLYNTYSYLLHDHFISYSYSATLLREMKKENLNKTTNTLVAFAPLFEDASKDTTIEEVRANLVPLRYNIPEVEKICSLIDCEKFIGTKATEEAFIDNCQNSKIVHIATHGKADDQVGDYSYLAFAKITDSTENKILFNRDIYNLKINADLVVLSACETGIGELMEGEGIISLARGFSYAGAKSIVTSLWNVNDKSTMAIMENFYGNLKKGEAKDIALTNAKRKFIYDNPEKAHPFYWAPFIPIGNMQPIFSASFKWIWLLAIIPFLILIFFYKKNTHK